MSTGAPYSEANSTPSAALTAVGGLASPPDPTPGAGKQHKRTYQACEPCRNRKVRCDLGSVDAPSDPPCLRCRREKKQCYFTETRRKRKANEQGGPDLEGYEDGNGGNTNGMVTPGRAEHLETMGVYTRSPVPGVMGRQSSVLSNSLHQQEVRVKGDGDEVRNDAAAALFQQPIHQPGDALRLLVDAASRSENMSLKRAGQSRGTAIKDLIDSPTAPVDPAIAKAAASQEANQTDENEALALQTWSRLRYVRAGWFTAREGMAYLDYFSRHLASLTPTLVPDFRDPAAHVKLLIEEPMLTVTLLTIASRYKKLTGAGGASRSLYIHSMLWKECQEMVTRMFWGQEHFGGSFGLAGGYRADTGEPVKRGLRGLGTVEALLLLSDWHPRSMHFPPAPGNDDILAPLQAEWEEANQVIQTRNPHQGWTEPAMRSDRMSWSLVGAAYNLAVELGVFDSMPDKGYFRPGYKTRAYDPERADRIGRLVHIYVSQTSGRLGYPNMLPNQGNDMQNAFFKMDLDNAAAGEPSFMPEQIQRAWGELTYIMRRVNSELFRSKQQTLDLIQSGKYTEVVESFWPDLRQWLQRVEAIKVPPETRTVLMMEYEYLRTYVNSLALQAQLEQYGELTANNPAAANSDNSALFSIRLVEISKRNAPYIAEVMTATRNLLKHVVNGLVPTGALKHSPVRTNFRILSGAMFLLKTFALGMKESDINHSIHLLNSTVEALRSTVIDDVHLSLRIADLLASLIKVISTKFVRVPIGNSRPGQVKRHRTSLSSKPHALAGGHHPPDSNKGANTTSPVMGKATNATSPDSSAASVNNFDLPFAPPLVNPNDPNIMIMPPPDYVYNFDNASGSIYSTQVSPRPAGAMPNGYPPNTFGPPSGSSHGSSSAAAGHNVHSPRIGVQHPPLKYNSPGQGQQPFSPISPGSGAGGGRGTTTAGGSGGGNGGYDWYAIDVNPLLQSNGGPGMQAGMGQGGMAWGTMFGPEIGEGLEMLGTLAEGFEFDDGIGATHWSG